MIYEFVSEKTENGKLVKTYRAGQSETKIYPIYKDKAGKQWYGFTNLNNIPYIRTAMAKHIINLYTMGLSLKDVLAWCKSEKEILKSDDSEKYEKLYALVLEKEKLATFTADPIKQHLALATVYVLGDDERVDYFDESLAEQKLKFWSVDLEATAFFLSWHNEHISRYLNGLDKASKIVLAAQRGLNKPFTSK